MLTIEIPAKLQELQPLVEAMELKWSNHYKSPKGGPWCIASRVGMTEEEAHAFVIQVAANEIARAIKSLNQTQENLTDLVDKLGKVTRGRGIK